MIEAVVGASHSFMALVWQRNRLDPKPQAAQARLGMIPSSSQYCPLPSLIDSQVFRHSVLPS